MQVIEQYDTNNRIFCYRVFFVPIRSAEEEADPQQRIAGIFYSDFYDADGDGKYESLEPGQGDATKIPPRVPEWTQSP